MYFIRSSIDEWWTCLGIKLTFTIMSRAVISPSSAGSPCQQTVDVLEKRLQAAERDTQELLQHLGGLGFNRHSTTTTPVKKTHNPGGDSTRPMTPTTVVTDTEVLQGSYEKLVSRVCKQESAIQTLKLALLNVQGNQDLRSKVGADQEEQWLEAKQSYETHITKLKRDIRSLREDVKHEAEAKNRLKSDVKKLQSALDDATTTRVCSIACVCVLITRVCSIGCVCVLITRVCSIGCVCVLITRVCSIACVC